MKKEKNILSLFLTFFKIGMFTFGGGYAMISLMQKEVVDNKKWVTEEDMSDMIVISESTPGPVAVNIATFVGYKVAGFFGSLCATLGVVSPSFFIIVLLASILDKLQNNNIFQNAFFGIRAAVIALILKTFLNIIFIFQPSEKTGNNTSNIINSNTTDMITFQIVCKINTKELL